jgi:hypothetical protein
MDASLHAVGGNQQIEAQHLAADHQRKPRGAYPNKSAIQPVAV